MKNPEIQTNSNEKPIQHCPRKEKNKSAILKKFRRRILQRDSWEETSTETLLPKQGQTVGEL